jgi:hypothetical protein
MIILNNKNKIIIAVFVTILITFGIVAFLFPGSGGVVYGNWRSADYWWVDEVTVVSIESGNMTLATGDTYTEWWLNGDRYFRVSEAAANVLEVGETYEMKIMHGIATNDVTAIRIIQ